jgi:hypothetical protein
VEEGKFTFQVAIGGRPAGTGDNIFQRYGVRAYPTNYLLDHEGRVVWRGVGFDENELKALRAALARLGVQ